MSEIYITLINRKSILLISVLGASLVSGSLLPIIFNLLNLTYIGSRLVYGMLLLFSLMMIAVHVHRWGIIGFVSPLTWSMLGFIYFFFLHPIIYPDYWQVYSDISNYWLLVVAISLGMISYVFGFILAPSIRLKAIRTWLERTVSSARMSNVLLVLIAIYIYLSYALSRVGNFGYIEFVTQNLYLLGNKQELATLFRGASYYLFTIFRQLPIALAVPIAFCIASGNIRRFKALLLGIGLLLMIAISVSFGGRSVLAYLLGGIGVYLYIRHMKRGRSVKKGTIAKSLLYSASILIVLFMLTSVQIGFRSKRKSIQVYGTKLMKAIRENIIDVTIDQNFTLYQVIEAERDNEIDYLWGESYSLAFVSLIPRRLWPSKPGGVDMYSKLSIIDPWGANYNISHSFIGELIYNFGSLSVVPGTIIFGILGGIWWKLFINYRSYSKTLIIYAITVIPVAFMVRGTFNAMFGGIMYPILLTSLILVVAKQKGG